MAGSLKEVPAPIMPPVPNMVNWADGAVLHYHATLTFVFLTFPNIVKQGKCEVPRNLPVCFRQNHLWKSKKLPNRQFFYD